MGGEHLSIVKNWDEVTATLALCFPDAYDIGMSHLGTKILYSVVNREPDLCLERVFCPWLDMERKLRELDLPLVSLETHQPLSRFDIVGFSLQYELTFTNILTMLDLGGIPLHSAERSLDNPLIIAGGPVATQPEPMAPFIDLFLVGDAEQRLPRLMRHYAEMKRDGRLSRTEMLVELAKEGGVYCPELYERELCERSGLLVVGKPKLPGVPERVSRAFVEDINRYQFPDDSPVPVAEAIFDRMAIEIARGCTEGCRFCQAGMIYRPVRERDPDQVVETLVSAVDKGGYDEAAITSLSTADYSCVSPLVRKTMERLRPKKIALGVSSLRAYGLDEDLLDEMASVKAPGLTFAPEAGTQRMRDVINKNITEDDIFTTCHRVFSRGWSRIKLYFMIGQPTEQDEDVVGIARMGKQAVAIGREHQRNVNVTVSVSTHVPKPHTPFQWCAMDSIEEIERKQNLLARSAGRSFKLRRHDVRVSHLEGIISRGDYRVGWLVERAWLNGARFDGWDEKFDWEIWQKSLDEWEEEYGHSRHDYLGTLPVDGRLPWDHIDMGLEEGFLAQEYKRALKGQLSPPCGKPFQAQVHHTNVEDARADTRKLICYHCGVACDLTRMRDERVRFLEKLGAHTRPKSKPATERQESAERVRKGKAPRDFGQGKPVRYRLRYSKLASMSLRGHLDMVRVLPRVLRRAGLPLYYSEGYSPRPVIAFGPALALGMTSLAEYADFALTEEVAIDGLLEGLTQSTEPGLTFFGVRRLAEEEPSLSKLIGAQDFLAILPVDEAGGVAAEKTLRSYQIRCQEILALHQVPVTVLRKGKTRTVDLKSVVIEAQVDWTDSLAPPPLMEVAPGRPAALLRLRVGSGASLRPAEITNKLFGLTLRPIDFLRLHCWHLTPDGGLRDPLDSGLPTNIRRARRPPAP
jgi:radical SAM family uncharacterized protein/radical SAM-linked protein